MTKKLWSELLVQDTSYLRAAVRLGELGFRLLPRDGWRSLALAAAMGLAFGAYMALADSFVFPSIVPEVQRALLGHERVRFDEDDCIELEKFQWQPSRKRSE